MNKREFVCRVAIAHAAAVTADGEHIWDDETAWMIAENLWDARPQWMKDDEKGPEATYKGVPFSKLTDEQRAEAESYGIRFWGKQT